MSRRGKSDYASVQQLLSDEGLKAILPSGDALGAILVLSQRLAAQAVKAAHKTLGVEDGSRSAGSNIAELLKKTATDYVKFWKAGVADPETGLAVAGPGPATVVTVAARDASKSGDTDVQDESTRDKNGPETKAPEDTAPKNGTQTPAAPMVTREASFLMQLTGSGMGLAEALNLVQKEFVSAAPVGEKGSTLGDKTQAGQVPGLSGPSMLTQDKSKQPPKSTTPKPAAPIAATPVRTVVLSSDDEEAADRDLAASKAQQRKNKATAAASGGTDARPTKKKQVKKRQRAGSLELADSDVDSGGSEPESDRDAGIDTAAAAKSPPASSKHQVR
jgi:hypothetical protein